jgi:hypothetical protein
VSPSKQRVLSEASHDQAGDREAALALGLHLRA